MRFMVWMLGCVGVLVTATNAAAELQQSKVVTSKAGVGADDASGRWKEIVTLQPRPVLKRRRLEVLPFYGVTLNDTLIRHHAVGLELNYFLTEVLSVGVQGIYYLDSVLDQEFYTRYHFSQVPSLNRYRYTVTGNWSYVPIYGKFTLFNDRIAHYDLFATAGVGVSGSEIIPRDYRYEPFSNPPGLTFPVGLGGRLFVNRFLAVQAVFRCYIMLDRFEPAQRGVSDPGRSEVATAKDNTRTDIVNNMIFNIGVSVFFPTGFRRATFR